MTMDLTTSIWSYRPSPMSLTNDITLGFLEQF